MQADIDMRDNMTPSNVRPPVEVKHRDHRHADAKRRDSSPARSPARSPHTSPMSTPLSGSSSFFKSHTSDEEWTKSRHGGKNPELTLYRVWTAGAHSNVGASYIPNQAWQESLRRPAVEGWRNRYNGSTHGVNNPPAEHVEDELRRYMGVTPSPGGGFLWHPGQPLQRHLLTASDESLAC